MGQINTNNYPTVNSLADADLLIVENATNGTGTTTPKQLRENAIGTATLQTSAQTVTGAINELKHEIDLGAGVARYDVNTITSGYLGQFSGSANLLLLHLTTDGTADATNGYMMMLSYSRPVARFAYGRLVDADGVAYKQDVYANNTIICKISNSGTGTESDPEQVVILGIINAGFMLTPTAVVSDRDIIDGQGNTLSVLAEALTKTASGNPVTITDCAGGKARSLITEINAIQDLHGLPFPYVGGAYKNKLPMTVASIKAANSSGTWTGNVYAINNGTIEILTDDAGNVTGIKANGTFSARANFILVSNTDISIFNGMIINGNPITDPSIAILRIEQIGGSWTGYSESGNADVTIGNYEASTTGAVYIRIFENKTVNNQTIRPMIRLSTESDATFAPYSNICPISGRTAAVITRSDGDEISEDFTIQLGTTVYGADINWDTGVATVTHVATSITGDNVSTISAQSAVDTEGGKRININITNAKYCGSGTGLSDIISDKLSVTSANSIYNNATPNCISVNDAGGIVLRYAGAATVEAAKAALNANPVQACYQLAAPTTIQLTPEQLELLKGYNRVSIESGSIELEYIAKLT